jgi:TolB-like protein
MQIRTAFFLIPFFAILSCTSVDKKIFVKHSKGLKEQIRIAVLPFKDAPGKEGSGMIVADTLASEMIKISNWTIVERTQLERVMKEKSLDMAGATDVDIEKIGTLFKTNYIVIGSVSDYFYERKFFIVPKTRLAFNARIIDVSTGSVVATVLYSSETNKHAWLGCCLLSWYYIPILIFSDENINDDMKKSAEEVVKEISRDVENKKGCCLTR